MPTPSDNTRRKYLSELVMGVDTFEETTLSNRNIARVTVHNASTLTDVSTIGTFVVWVDANDRYEIANDSSVIGSEDGTLPEGAKVGLIVGPRSGMGQPTTGEASDGVVTVGAAGTEVTVLFCDASILRDGIEYAGRSITTGGTKTALENQLMKQRCRVYDGVDTTDASFI